MAAVLAQNEAKSILIPIVLEQHIQQEHLDVMVGYPHACGNVVYIFIDVLMDPLE